ncbi:hypothetical protein PC129_g8613 [Phytophthora cactorum]|uniref:Calponin-homology (CH) domain-containing protein n=1 Tax=Phytophthora cactorum TaxID=29920 RepID=A0A8T1B8B2_9STRA|nr:hypothetical protein PC112_g10883 [Phytophthora cactorum]KAG2897500.1 hypothetical protein PC115_g17156 [Phytophthora cactorum]KAG2912504.1 hypothetical protein PC114_g8872 [Phytophthora cactorum]KAG2938069.1 hypothetical protein PC117_g11422 [Phytophthora cactorum]KAG2969202.1 hypothetical protein PC118_g17579 [Phytophthora cactorum]
MGSLNVVFAFMQKKNVSVTNIDSSDILDGNNKLVRGLIRTLIMAFQAMPMRNSVPVIHGWKYAIFLK